MGKLKNMLIEMEEMNLTGEPLPWEMGAPLCKKCDNLQIKFYSKEGTWPTKDGNCSYCDEPMQVLDK